MPPATELDTQFARRAEQWRPDLLAALERLYDDPEGVAARLLDIARAAHDARPDELHDLDRRRLAEPDWFQRSSALGYAAYAGMPRGRALHLSPDQPEGLNRDSVLTVRLVRGFCAQLGIVEKPALTALRRCRDAAYALWPALIEAADLTERMKAGLLRQLQWHRDAQTSGQRALARPSKA